MPSNLVFCFLALISGAVVEQFASAAEICEIEPVTDPLVAGRANQVRFPDGRLITVVGHRHGKRQATRIALRAEEAKNLTAAQFDNLIRATLQENSIKRNIDLGPMILEDMAQKFEISPSEISDATLFRAPFPISSVLEDARADYRYLQSHLARIGDRPQFVGLETNQSEWLGEVRRGFNQVKANISRLRNRMTVSDQQIEDFLVSGSMGHVYAYLSDPSLAQVLPLVAIEGGEVRIDGNLGEDFGEMNLPELYRMHINSLPAERRPEAKREMVQFLEIFVKAFTAYQFRFPDQEPRQLAQELRGVTPAWLWESGKKLADILAKSGESIRRRDRQSSINLVNQRRSGIHFVGLLHLIPQTRGLQDLCKIEMAKDSRFPKTWQQRTYDGVR